MTSATRERWSAERSRKFRQAAFVYLHTGILYESTMFAMMRAEMAPERLGSPVVWLALGALITLLVVGGLYWWQNHWLARVIWGIHGMRLPWLIRGAFFAEAGRLPPSFYLTAIVVVVITLWALARAGWDL